MIQPAEIRIAVIRPIPCLRRKSGASLCNFGGGPVIQVTYGFSAGVRKRTLPRATDCIRSDALKTTMSWNNDFGHGLDLIRSVESGCRMVARAIYISAISRPRP